MGRMSAGLIAIMTKVGFKLLSVMIKFAKIGKVGMAVGTMATYSYLFTWQFALVLMVSLFVHENGHVWMMKRCGMVVKGIYFIPFVGAAAVAEGDFPSPKDEANIAIMGPIWGLILVVFTIFVYKITGSAFFGAIAGWMAMMNLFNLLPISPLDGGRIMKSIAFSIGSNTGLIFMMVGIAIFMAITIWKGIVLFAALLIIALMEFVFTYYDIRRHIKKGIDVRSIKIYSPMSIKNVILSVSSYIVVTVILWVLMVYVENIPEVEAAKSIFM